MMNENLNDDMGYLTFLGPICEKDVITVQNDEEDRQKVMGGQALNQVLTVLSHGHDGTLISVVSECTLGYVAIANLKENGIRNKIFMSDEISMPESIHIVKNGQTVTIDPEPIDEVDIPVELMQPTLNKTSGLFISTEMSSETFRQAVMAVNNAGNEAPVYVFADRSHLVNLSLFKYLDFDAILISQDEGDEAISRSKAREFAKVADEHNVPVIVCRDNYNVTVFNQGKMRHLKHDAKRTKGCHVSQDVFLANIAFQLYTGADLVEAIQYSQRNHEDPLCDVYTKTDRSEVEAEVLNDLYIKAFHDQLTDVLNRDGFEKDIRSFNFESGDTVLAMVDIDHFKKLNDTYGHDDGDMVLKELADRMQSSIRDSDILCRWGGEEFIIVFNSSNVDKAHETLDRIRQMVHQVPFDLSDAKVNVSISVGFSLVHTPESLDVAREAADKALYKAKETRNQVSYQCSLELLQQASETVNN